MFRSCTLQEPGLERENLGLGAQDGPNSEILRLNRAGNYFQSIFHSGTGKMGLKRRAGSRLTRTVSTS